MATLYSIRDWALHFEKAQTRSVKHISWVPLPVKHDGGSYRRLMAMPNGPAVFAAWVLIVQVAAKCKERGVLSDGDFPYSAEDLALKTGAPELLFQEALQVLSSPRVGWLLSTDYECDDSALIERRNALQLQTDRIGQDSTGEDIPPKVPQGGRAAKYPSAFEAWWQAYPRKEGKQKAFMAWKRAGRRVCTEHAIEAQEAAERLQEAATAFAASDAGRDPVYCPHPATWLNNGRYDDDRTRWVRAGPVGAISGSVRDRAKDFKLD